MPAPGRSDEEIVAEALEVINPLSDNRDTTRSDIFSVIDGVRAVHLYRQPSPGKRKEDLKTYLENLLATKRTFVRGASDEELLKHLDDEIKRIQCLYDHEVRMVGKGSKPPDWTAAVAAGMAK